MKRKHIFFAIYYFIAWLLIDRIIYLFPIVPKSSEIQITHPPLYKREIKNYAYHYFFETNSYGFRGPEPDRNYPCIYFAGDSYTEGVGVSDKESIVRLIEDSLRRQEIFVNCINGGLSGTGPLEYGRVLILSGLKLNLKSVILCFHTNDIDDTDEHVRPEDLLRTAVPIRRPWYGNIFPSTYYALHLIKERINKKSYQKPDPLWFKQKVEKFARERGVSFEKFNRWAKQIPDSIFRMIGSDSLNVSGITKGLFSPEYLMRCVNLNNDLYKKKWGACKNILSFVVDTLSKKNIKVGLVFIPDPFEFSNSYLLKQKLLPASGIRIDSTWISKIEPLEKELERFTNEKKIPFLNLKSFYKNMDGGAKEIVFLYDGHLTAWSNLQTAKRILSWMDENRLSIMAVHE